MTDTPLPPHAFRKLEKAAEPLARPESGRIGRYEILGVLGTGASSVVYRARDAELDRAVALKLLRDPALDWNSVRARFDREAQALASLAHPNILKVHDSGEWHGRPYLVLEIVEEGSLERLLAARSASQERLVAILAKAARAVGAAHAAGIVHRDLKPSNILVTADDEPKVGDFGLALAATSARLTRSGVVVGTPLYMAPEQAAGASGLVGPRTDVYALGAVLYEILTGRPPHQAADPSALFADILTREPLPPHRINRNVNGALEALCLKALARRPEDRYATASELGQDLTRYLESGSTSARGSRRIGRMAVWSGAGVLGFALLMGALRLASNGDPGQARLLEEGQRGIRRVEGLLSEEHTRERWESAVETARSNFERVLAGDPGHAEALLGLGRVWALAKEEGRALDCFDRAIAAKPSFAPAYLERMRLRLQRYEALRHDQRGVLAESEEARALREGLREDLRRVEIHFKGTEEKAYAEGLLAMADGDYEAAQRKLAGYLESWPDDWRARTWRAHALYHLKRYEEVESETTRTLRSVRRLVAAYLDRGMARYQRGDLPGAIADFTDTLRLDPDHWSAWFHRGLAHFRAEDCRAAIADLDRAVRIRPGLEAFNARGVVKERQGALEEAIEDFSRAIEMAPAKTEGYLNRALAYRRKGDFEKACSDLDRVVELDGRDWGAFGVRGELRLRLGNNPGARGDLERALEMAPADWAERPKLRRMVDALPRE